MKLRKRNNMTDKRATTYRAIKCYQKLHNFHRKRYSICLLPTRQRLGTILDFHCIFSSGSILILCVLMLQTAYCTYSSGIALLTGHCNASSF